MDEYPDSDFPWTLYFQGVAMPKWANCWYFHPMADSSVDWYVDQVHGRLDHVGVIESENSDIFAIVAQQVLLSMLERKEEFIRELDHPPAEREGIYDGLLSGLQRMIVISDDEEVVFWTSGYVRDQEKLIDAMRRFRLGASHPDYFCPPHRIRRRQERLSHLNLQRRKLRGRSATTGLPKAVKRFLHDLDDRKKG
jgi:hypothetical protein